MTAAPIPEGETPKIGRALRQIVCTFTHPSILPRMAFFKQLDGRLGGLVDGEVALAARLRASAGLFLGMYMSAVPRWSGPASCVEGRALLDGIDVVTSVSAHVFRWFDGSPPTPRPPPVSRPPAAGVVIGALGDRAALLITVRSGGGGTSWEAAAAV